MKIYSSANEAIASIQSGQRIFMHGAAATPTRLLGALVESAERFNPIEIFHLHTLGPAHYADPIYSSHIKVSAFFVGANMRSRLSPGVVDYIPCFLSEIPLLIRSRRIPLDVALIHVSPPDRHGFCTLGTSVDAARAAVDTAPIVIAQINKRMPRMHGDGFVHISQIHHAIEVDDPLPEEKPAAFTPEEGAIAQLAASIIENGSTLQMGIGAIPDAILSALKGHKHLGIHTEMWSDGALALIQCGAVDNSQKKIHPGRTVAGFVMGTQALYDFVNDNPSTVGLDIGYVNSPMNISRNPKVVAINSAVEVDLTGQVCADSVGSRVISGAGGQIDFIRGATFSKGGKPIIALTGRTKKGLSRIVPVLKTGAGVVTTRAHVHFIITEYGIADLYGKTLAQRAKALIAIAHPEDREKLEYDWRKIYGAGSGVGTGAAVGALLLAMHLGPFSQDAFAHPGHGLHTFSSGFVHPISGLDHLLAALAVGIWAAGRRRISAAGPLAFLLGILSGALAGQFGIEIPFCEGGILLSIILLGISLFFVKFTSQLERTFKPGLMVPLLFVFGAFHGNAHGLEVLEPGSLALSAPLLGLIASTAILHGIGIAGISMVRRVLNEQRTIWVLRWAGVGFFGAAFLI